jgi:group I intron endonuclease
MHYLYKITNRLNGKIYIGQTINLITRWNNHKASSRANLPKLVISRVIKKYGYNNFNFENIATCKTLDDANIIECILIDQYNSHISNNIGYNVDFGGHNSIRSQLTKDKMSRNKKGQLNPMFGKPSPNRGKITSDEIKIKISEAHTGKKLSNEHKKSISKSLIGNKRSLGRKLTEEHKQKLSKFKPSESHKQAVRNANIGKIKSQETRKKLSECQKGILNHNYIQLTQDQITNILLSLNAGISESKLSKMLGLGRHIIHRVKLENKLDLKDGK